MSDKTAIEWTEATWNPVTGCSKVSQGCKNCYAEREWARISAPRDRCKPNRYTGRAFTDVAYHQDLLDRPLRWQKPRMIFVNSMSDLFHENVPDEFIDKVFAVMALCPRHSFQVLTKRVERMHKYMARLGSSAKILDAAARTIGYTFEHKGQYLCSWPIPNIWLGVSVEDQATADERIPLLLQTPAAVRWVSAEPLLGHIDLDSERDDGLHALGCGDKDCSCGDRGIDWLVVGGESGPRARPMHPEWVRSIRDQCQAADVPFFFKQWGEWAPDIMLESGRGSRANSQPVSSGKLADVAWMTRFGKKTTGRMLDGRTWDEYPV